MGFKVQGLGLRAMGFRVEDLWIPSWDSSFSGC